MAEQPKRMILAKGHCGTCQSPISVEVPEPEPKVEVKREPCKCGRTEFERAIRWIALAIISLILGLTGSCITNQYFTTVQVREMSEKYQIRKRVPGEPREPNEPDYVIEPKPEPAKK